MEDGNELGEIKRQIQFANRGSYSVLPISKATGESNTTMSYIRYLTNLKYLNIGSNN